MAYLHDQKSEVTLNSYLEGIEDPNPTPITEKSCVDHSFDQYRNCSLMVDDNS